MGIYTNVDTQANRPDAGNVGNLFLPSNGYHLQRDDDSVWQAWGTLFPMTLPVSDDFSWINQDTASIDASQGGVYILDPAGANGLHLRVKSAPETPYVITAAILAHAYNVNYSKFGVCWRQSSDGKLIAFTLRNDQISKLNLQKYTDADTFSADYKTVEIIPHFSILFLRLEDDGSDRKSHWSTDGQHFHEFHSVGRTDFMTADQVGFFVGANNANYPAGMLLLSWLEA